MAHYESQFTGKEIDAVIALFNGTNLNEVRDGAVFRTSGGNFLAVKNENEGESESDYTLSLVTKGEKYTWNHMIPLTQRGVANGVATLNEDGYLPLTQFSVINEQAAEGGTDLSFVTTGDKYIWNNHTITKKGIAISTEDLPGFFKVQTNEEGHLVAATSVTKDDITDLGIIGDIVVIPASHSSSTDERVKVGTIRIDGVDTELYAVMGDQNIGVNSETNDGYVPASNATDPETGVMSPNPYKYWSTDSNGTPGWHDSKKEGQFILWRADWQWQEAISHYTQEVVVPGVTSDNTVIISPNPAQIVEYGRCGIFGYEQVANMVTFRCMQQPKEDVEVNIMVLNYAVPSIPEETEGE